MTWTEAGEFLITEKETDLPASFTSLLAIKPVDFTLLKPSWKWAGYFIQCITIPVIGQVRIEAKIDLSTREPTLIIPKYFESNYQLKFYKADWIPQFKLIIYENDMAIYGTPDPIIFPNTKITSSVATTVAPSTTSVQLLAANANRKKVIISNLTNQVLILELGPTASVATSMLTLAPRTAGGSVYTYEDDDYTGVISAISPATASGSIQIREMT